MSRELPSGTVTFLFRDIEGSTRLLHELGPERYADALHAHRLILRKAFSTHGGVEVDTQGDAFFVAFATADGALAAAEDAKAALAKTVVSTASSHPRDSRFFRAHAPGCDNCATFHGDYIGVAYGSDGKANMAWTDMRDPDPSVAGLFDQFVYFAKK